MSAFSRNINVIFKRFANVIFSRDKSTSCCTCRAYYLGYSCFPVTTTSFQRQLVTGDMSSTRRATNRKRPAAGASELELDNERKDGDTSENIVTAKKKGGQATRSKRTIKIELEVEPKSEEETTEEVSKYFQTGDKSEKKNKNSGSKTASVSSAVKVKDEDVQVTVGNAVPSPSKKKNVEPLKVDPPKNWEKMLENIQIMRSTKTAAVDTMGCERTADLNKEPHVQRFHTLVSLMLSSQTKDQVTFAAMERLKERDLTVQRMIDIDEAELAAILKPVGFFNRKATYIKKVAGILREKYDDDIPRSIEDLCALPGVGPKMAYICMNAAWNENAGIGVDTHVHRITNRLKWTGAKGTSTPEKTREALESWLLKELWQEVNILLVGFGQEICLPIGPKCGTCLNKDICPSASIPKKPKAKGSKKD